MNGVPVNLAVDGLSVRFGGLLAVDHVSLSAPAASVTGLIGPNGAGKTTIFNACTGVVPAASGTVTLGDTRLDGLPTAKRAQLGLGRTFQRIELFDSMTVRENVAMGPESLDAGRRARAQLVASRRQRRDALERADAAIDRCGITALAGRAAGELSTGQRRLVELARAIASPFSFLLLDEPSSGLDAAETDHFATILEGFVADTGLGILLVEHDMALVRRMCTYIYVLDFGKLIYDGPAADVLQSEIVKAAYLGTEAVVA